MSVTSRLRCRLVGLQGTYYYSRSKRQIRLSLLLQDGLKQPIPHNRRELLAERPQHVCTCFSESLSLVILLPPSQILGTIRSDGSPHFLVLMEQHLFFILLVVFYRLQVKQAPQQDSPRLGLIA